MALVSPSGSGLKAGSTAVPSLDMPEDRGTSVEDGKLCASLELGDFVGTGTGAALLSMRDPVSVSFPVPSSEKGGDAKEDNDCSSDKPDGSEI